MNYPVDITKSLREIIDSSDNISAKDIIQTEVMLWGFDEDTDEFKVFTKLAEIKPTDDIIENGLDYYKACGIISKKLKIKADKIKDILNGAVEKANFSKSMFIPVFAKMDRKEITPEGVVKQLYDFVIYDNEE